MKPKVLKTERDYKAALAHVGRLMDQTSPDEDELELWSLLVEKFEDEHFPIPTPDCIAV
jgi:HTH-type transcriptional regulator/antitoxin HigA